MRASDFVATYGPQGVAAWEAAAKRLASSPTTFFTGPFLPVPVSIPGHQGVFFAAQDYASIGEGDDFMRIPLTPGTAQEIADLYGYSLPTPRMVKTIWQASARRLLPEPIRPYPPNTLASYLAHSRSVDAQIQKAWAGDVGPNLLAGHKKDVVLTNQYAGKPNPGVAIYGWQNADGSVIQGLNAADPPQGHAANYADYSHGIRFIAPAMIVDGVEVPLAHVFSDPVLSALVSGEGPLRFTRYPTRIPPPSTPPLAQNGPGNVVPASYSPPPSGALANLPQTIARASSAFSVLAAMGTVLALSTFLVRKFPSHAS